MRSTYTAAGPAVALCALALAACGAKSDKDTISDIIKDVGAHPADLCNKYVTPSLLAQAGGKAKCLQAAAAPSSVDPNIKVLSVTVTGSSATASIQTRSGRSTVAFQKQGGAWKATSLSG